MSEQQGNAVLDARVTNVERAVERVTAAVESIDESLKVLTRLDVKHEETNKGLGRAFEALEKHDGRIRDIETEMPTMKLIRGWVIAGTIMLASTVALAVMNLVLK